MTIEDLGYTTELEAYRLEQNWESLTTGRVILEHKDRYIVKTIEGDFDAEIIGNLRYAAEKRADFPAVGDWVAISPYDDDKALIHSVYPRKSMIEREAVGQYAEKQIIAANVDYALILQAVDRDYSINRIERYLTICHKAGVIPLVVLTKIDLIEKSYLGKIIGDLEDRLTEVPILSLSNISGAGLDEIKSLIQVGMTYCLMGSSGVGKSTLINNLVGEEVMKTNAIGASANRGRHVTTHRELIILKEGGILIDNPGMREVGVADAAEGLSSTFSSIVEIARDCKFNDCSHETEKGCAIQHALESGAIEEEALVNYQKMLREKDHFEMTLLEKRRKDKEFGKMIKDVKKGLKYRK